MAYMKSFLKPNLLKILWTIILSVIVCYLIMVCNAQIFCITFPCPSLCGTFTDLLLISPAIPYVLFVFGIAASYFLASLVVNIFKVYSVVLLILLIISYIVFVPIITK